MAAEGEELRGADEDGAGAAAGVEGGKLDDLAGVKVEVEGPVLAALVDYVDVAGGEQREVDGVARGDAAGDAGDEVWLRCGREGEAIEVDLDGRGVAVRRWGRVGVGWTGFEWHGSGFGLGGTMLEGFDEEHLGVGGELDGDDPAGEGEEGILGEGLGLKGGEGGEGVADAEQEVAAAEVPEVAGVVVEAPGGAGEDAAGGEVFGREFEEEGVYGVVDVFGRVFGDAGHEAADGKGDEEMVIVDVVQGKETAARGEKLRLWREEAEGREGDVSWRFGGFGRGEEPEAEKEAERGEAETAEPPEGRGGVNGNRHGRGRVLMKIERVELLCHRRTGRDNRAGLWMRLDCGCLSCRANWTAAYRLEMMLRRGEIAC